MLPKNPSRVPMFSQTHNPKGSAPEPRHVVGLKGPQTMNKAEKAGTYKDEKGNQFFYREGAELPEGLELVEAADRNAGAPERRGDDGKAEKAEKPAKAPDADKQD